MNGEIIKNCKDLINNNELIDLQNYYKSLVDLNLNVGEYQYIYQKILIFSCYKGNDEILKWLTDLYFEFDEFSKIFLRQVFFYCKYILLNKKHNIIWYEKFLTKIRDD